jgi:hypothetical protein
LRKEVGNRGSIALSLAGLGEVAVQSGQPEKGARLLGASDDLRQALGVLMWADDRIPYEHAVALARLRLREEAFERAWQEGQAMSMEEAIEHALEQRSEQ